MDLVGAGAGIERAVGADGNGEWVVGGVDFDQATYGGGGDGVGVGARGNGTAADDDRLGKELEAEAGGWGCEDAGWLWLEVQDPEAWDYLEMSNVEGRHVVAYVQCSRANQQVFEGDADSTGRLFALNAASKLCDFHGN